MTLETILRTVLHAVLGPVARGTPQTFPPRLAAHRPATAQDVEEWELRGAYDDAIRIPATNWFFQTPDGFVDGLTVFSRGEFRPDVGHLYFPRPFTNDLALLPRSRWGLLPNGGESKLWYAATPSNSLLVTWVNGLLDRDPLTWNGSGAGGGGARLMSASTGCSCASGNGRTVTMGCARECVCGGGCVASGSFGFEGIGLAVTGGVCRCGFDDPPPPDEPSYEPDDPASFSVTFSKSAVIYEDEYEDSPGVTVPKRSTRVRITVAAYGGPNGGALSLTTRGLGRLVSVDGGAIAFDPPSALDAREPYFASFVCEGEGQSASEGDVRIGGTFTENTTHAVINQDKALTVVRVDLRTNKDAPLNTSSSRHQYGIGEDVIFHQFPSAPSTTLDLKDATVTGSGGARMIRWGISNVVHTLKICADSAEYTPQISVVCPQRVEGCNARAYTSGLAPGVAGGLELRQAYRIHPLTVSFEGLSIEEVPCDEVIPPQGYFAFTPTNIFLRSHTRGAGAGEWFEVTEGNWVGSESSHDRAGYLGQLPRMMPDGTATTNTAFGWLGGSLTWKVPFGWSKDQARGSTADPVDCFAEDTVQIFRVNADGDFSVEKLKHKAERKITDEVNVYNLSNQPE